MSVKEPELSLSFVDLLSCSLGTMILLFLIFATMSHDGSEDSQSETGTNSEMIEVGGAKEESSRPNVPQLFEVTLTGMGGDARGTLVAKDPPEGTKVMATWPLNSHDVAATSRWLVWIPPSEPGNASAVQFQIEPANTRFLATATQLTMRQESIPLGFVIGGQGAASLEFSTAHGWKKVD